MEYTVPASGEVKVDVYSEPHKQYIETQHDGDMESERMDEFTFDANRWPVGTRIIIKVPVCPKCEVDAEFQDESGKCECGFDWRVWAEEQYS